MISKKPPFSSYDAFPNSYQPPPKQETFSKLGRQLISGFPNYPSQYQSDSLTNLHENTPKGISMQNVVSSTLYNSYNKKNGEF